VWQLRQVHQQQAQLSQQLAQQARLMRLQQE
jgi:hypothetical protein